MPAIVTTLGSLMGQIKNHITNDGMEWNGKIKHYIRWKSSRAS